MHHGLRHLHRPTPVQKLVQVDGGVGERTRRFFNHNFLGKSVFGDTPPTVIALDPALPAGELGPALLGEFMRQPTWLAVAGHVREFDPDADLARAFELQEALGDFELGIATAKPEKWPRNGIACFNIAHDELGQAWPLGGVAPLRAGVALCRELGTKRLQIWTHHDSKFLQEADAIALEMANKHGIEFKVESPLLSKAP